MKIRLLFLCLFVALKTNAQGNWTQKPSFPGNTREGAIGFSIGNYGYLGLGYTDAAAVYLHDFARFDPAANTWSIMASFPGAARWGASSFAIGSKGYVTCGFSNYTYYSDTWMFDATTNTWTQKANFPGGTRWYGVGFSIGTKGYIGLGSLSASAIWYCDLWEYDPTTNTWAQKANYPGGVKYNITAFTINNKAYLVCGTGTVSGCNSDVWEYDPVNDSWVQKASYPGTPCDHLVSFSIGNYGYAGTGKVNGNGPATTDFYKYDPSQDLWTPISFLPSGTERFAAVAFNIGNSGYVATGSQAQPPPTDLNDLWEYSTSSVGLDENTNDDQFALLPNPSNDQFSISTNDNKIKIVRITDNKGTIIQEHIIQNKITIDTRNFINGIYFVTTRYETRSIIKKLVVIH